MKKPTDAAQRTPTGRAVNQAVKVQIRQLPTGVRGLDEILGGGIPELSCNIVATFEERPKVDAARADSLGLALTRAQKQGQLKIIYLRPLDLSVDETKQEFLDAIIQIGAMRLVIDSLVGLEMALAPDFREDFREYVIAENGLVILGPRHTDYYGLLTGIPRRTDPRVAQQEKTAPEPMSTQ